MGSGKIPRKAPKEVIEHRVTFGNFERDLIVKELAASNENKMKVAGINQVGQIAGSGVLLWGLAAYFGYNLVSELKDKVNNFVDSSSTGLANMWMQAFGGLTAKEAQWVSRMNDLLNQRVIELNAREAAKDEQIRTVNMSVINGHMTFQEAKMILDEIGEVPSAETLEERQAIVDARAKLATIKASMNESQFENLIDGWPSFQRDGLANLIKAI